MGLAQVGTETLLGRKVQMNVVTYTDPASPHLVSRDYIATVGPGPEFGTVREGRQGLDVVPAIIDFEARMMMVSFAEPEAGAFAEATFNGYVLTFLTECVLIAGAQLDAMTTTLPMTDANLLVTPQSLQINVSGLTYAPGDTIAVAIEVLDCPMS